MMRTFILTQVPYFDITTSITTDQFTLVGMNDDIIDGKSMNVIPLYVRRSSIPDLDRPILGTGDHPFPFAMESDSRDIPAMTFERAHRIRVGILDVEQLHRMTSGGGKVSFVRGDAKSIYLGIRMLNRSRADARECFPETESRNRSHQPVGKRGRYGLSV